MTHNVPEGAKPLRKRVVLWTAKLLIAPFTPVIALGYWASYDGNQSYWWCLKDIWSDLL